MKRYYCPKCNQPRARFIGCNGDGVYLAGLAFDCVACGYQWEAEEYPRVAERKAPTTAHLIAERKAEALEEAAVGFEMVPGVLTTEAVTHVLRDTAQKLRSQAEKGEKS